MEQWSPGKNVGKMRYLVLRVRLLDDSLLAPRHEAATCTILYDEADQRAWATLYFAIVTLRGIFDAFRYVSGH